MFPCRRANVKRVIHVGTHVESNLITVLYICYGLKYNFFLSFHIMWMNLEIKWIPSLIKLLLFCFKSSPDMRENLP